MFPTNWTNSNDATFSLVALSKELIEEVYLSSTAEPVASKRRFQSPLKGFLKNKTHLFPQYQSAILSSHGPMIARNWFNKNIFLVTYWKTLDNHNRLRFRNLKKNKVNLEDNSPNMTRMEFQKLNKKRMILKISLNWIEGNNLQIQILSYIFFSKKYMINLKIRIDYESKIKLVSKIGKCSWEQLTRYR
jgi:hypothetical protein